jgi:hypothetical protein
VCVIIAHNVIKQWFAMIKDVNMKVIVKTAKIAGNITAP